MGYVVLLLVDAEDVEVHYGTCSPLPKWALTRLECISGYVVPFLAEAEDGEVHFGICRHADAGPARDVAPPSGGMPGRMSSLPAGLLASCGDLTLFLFSAACPPPSWVACTLPGELGLARGLRGGEEE